MDTVTTIAVFSGVSGFVASMVALSLGLLKQNSENKKNKLEENKYTSETASNLVGTAKTLNEMYETALDECKEKIVDLQKQIIELKKIVEEHVKTIESHQKTIDSLTNKDKDSFALISRLIKGINTLIKQLKRLDIIPDWIPSDADIQSEIVGNVDT